ncbi:hypothetical protein BDZ89DRAFT_1066290 [Hymenopellis radicata]|nr:hypothetical protein BDZ89DRAFT_1066290 [Hymenopellis radicata]
MRPLPPPPNAHNNNNGSSSIASGSTNGTSSSSISGGWMTGSTPATSPPSAYQPSQRPLPQRPKVGPRGMRTTKRSRSASESRAQIAFDASSGSWVVVPPDHAPPSVKDKGKGRARDPPPVAPLSIRKHSASSSRPRPTPPEFDLNVLSRAHMAKKLMVHNPDDEEDAPPLHKHVIVEYGSESDHSKESKEEQRQSSPSPDPTLFRSYVDIVPAVERSPSPMRYARRDSLDSLYSPSPSHRKASPPLSPLFTGPSPSPHIEDTIIFSDNPSPTLDDDDLLDLPPRRRKTRARSLSPSVTSTYAPSSQYAPSNYAPSQYAPSISSHSSHPNSRTHLTSSPKPSFDRERFAPSSTSSSAPAFDPQRFAPLQSLAPYNRGRDPAKKPRFRAKVVVP